MASAPPWDASRSLMASRPARPNAAAGVDLSQPPPTDADDGYYLDELLALTAERHALYALHRHRTHGVREKDAAIDRILDAWWTSRHRG